MNIYVVPPVWNLAGDRLIVNPSPQQETRVVIDKHFHEVKFEDETEHEVTVVIRPKELETK